MNFEILYQDSMARCGQLFFLRGAIHTPVFMPAFILPPATWFTKESLASTIPEAPSVCCRIERITCWIHGSDEHRDTSNHDCKGSSS